jgi:hypothetical protein
MNHHSATQNAISFQSTLRRASRYRARLSALEAADSTRTVLLEVSRFEEFGIRMFKARTDSRSLVAAVVPVACDRPLHRRRAMGVPAAVFGDFSPLVRTDFLGMRMLILEIIANQAIT